MPGIEFAVKWEVCDPEGRTMTPPDYATKQDAEAVLHRLTRSGTIAYASLYHVRPVLMARCDGERFVLSRESWRRLGEPMEGTEAP